MPGVAEETISIGIDPASSKVALVALGDGGTLCLARLHGKLGKSGGESCAKAMEVVGQFVTDMREAWPEVGLMAWIEAGVVGRGGVRATLVQSYTSGAIQGKLHECGVPVSTVNVSTWKKNVVGRGNATKEDVGSWLRLRWPYLHSVAGGNQDLMDATAIALYGRQVLAERMG